MPFEDAPLMLMLQSAGQNNLHLTCGIKELDAERADTLYFLAPMSLLSSICDVMLMVD